MRVFSIRLQLPQSQIHSQGNWARSCCRVLEYKTMKAIVFDRFGDPAEVLQVRDLPVPEPGRGQVRVRMIYSPINPSDLMVVRGQYGRLPDLPATPGFEGVGVVESGGGGLLGR